eukprot:2739868-Pleurochrysis_carterae.AAC.4
MDSNLARPSSGCSVIRFCKSTSRSRTRLNTPAHHEKPIERICPLYLGYCYSPGRYYGFNRVAGFGTSLNHNVRLLLTVIVMSDWVADVTVMPDSALFKP